MKIVPNIKCDPMVRIFLTIWPFATLKISPTVSQICQVGSAFCQIRKKLSKISPKTCKLLPEWRNFAKSGHTANILEWLNGITINVCNLTKKVSSTFH